MLLKKKKKKKFGSNGIPKMPKALRKKLRQQKQREADAGMLGWATTDPSKIRDQLAFQRSQSGKNRPPELFVKNGETKRIRFRDDEPVASIWQYSARSNGRWGSYTMPAEGQKDYFKKAGLRPGLKVLYEVIDRTGYTDKKGKRVRNIPRFYRVSGKLNQQIEVFRNKFGGLTGYDIDITRTGESTDTTYQLIPNPPSKLPLEIRKQPRLRKEFSKFYAPIPASEQKAIVNMIEDDDDDEKMPY